MNPLSYSTAIFIPKMTNSLWYSFAMCICMKNTFTNQIAFKKLFICVYLFNRVFISFDFNYLCSALKKCLQPLRIIQHEWTCFCTNSCRCVRNNEMSVEMNELKYMCKHMWHRLFCFTHTFTSKRKKWRDKGTGWKKPLQV